MKSSSISGVHPGFNLFEERYMDRTSTAVFITVNGKIIFTSFKWVERHADASQIPHENKHISQIFIIFIVPQTNACEQKCGVSCVVGWVAVKLSKLSMN